MKRIIKDYRRLYVSILEKEKIQDYTFDLEALSEKKRRHEEKNAEKRK